MQLPLWSPQSISLSFPPQFWWRIWLRCYHGYHPRLSFWLGASDAGSTPAVWLFLSKLSLPLAHSAFLSSLSLPLSFSSSSYFLLFPSQKSSSNAILQRTDIAIEVFSFKRRRGWRKNMMYFDASKRFSVYAFFNGSNRISAQIRWG